MRVRAALSTLGVALALPMVAADAEAPVALHDVAVVVDGDSVQVTGTSTFDVAAIAFEDDAGDGRLPGSDLGTGTIRQSDDREIAFSLELADVPSEFPPTLAYVWPLDDAGTQLVAWPNSTRSDAPQWTFAVVLANGANSSDAEVPGEYADGVITWLVSPAAIGSRPGAVLGADEFGDPLPLGEIAASISVDSATWVISGSDADVAANETNFAIGGAARLVLRTPDGRYLDEASTRLKRGVFSGGFEGLAPGKYLLEVVAQAGQDEAVQAFPITIA